MKGSCSCSPRTQGGLGSVFLPRISPQPRFLRGENSVKVPLFKGDLGGSESDGEGKKTRPRGVVQDLRINITLGLVVIGHRSRNLIFPKV